MDKVICELRFTCKFKTQNRNQTQALNPNKKKKQHNGLRLNNAPKLDVRFHTCYNKPIKK